MPSRCSQGKTTGVLLPWKREAARVSTALDGSDGASKRFLGVYIVRWLAMAGVRKAPVSGS